MFIRKDVSCFGARRRIRARLRSALDSETMRIDPLKLCMHASALVEAPLLLRRLRLPSEAGLKSHRSCSIRMNPGVGPQRSVMLYRALALLLSLLKITFEVVLRATKRLLQVAACA